jgi:uncharacterized protein (DUF1684 family)
MNARTLIAVGLVVATAAACTRTREEPAAPPANDAWRQGVQAWRDRHEADYTRDWASIAGLHWLDAGTHTVGSGDGNDIVVKAAVPETIGRLVVDGDRIVYEPQEGVPVKRAGLPISGPIVMKDAGSEPADEITIDDVRLVVHTSGKRMALRVRDPNSTLAKQFAGFAWFPIDPQYRVIGRFVADEKPRNVPVVTTFGDEDFALTEGVVEFTLNGETVRLRPFTTRPNRLWFVFRDASSGQETYETARFLYSDLRDDGTVVVDFNEAYNPPCAFNPYTTCPIPLRENRLPIKILAGEKNYIGQAPKPSAAS